LAGQREQKTSDPHLLQQFPFLDHFSKQMLFAFAFQSNPSLFKFNHTVQPKNYLKAVQPLFLPYFLRFLNGFAKKTTKIP